jgi:hypothetical protein
MMEELSALKPERELTRQRLLAFIESWGASERFEDLTLEIFRYQFAHCLPFAELCRSRGIFDPQTLSSIDAIPLVPTDAFKMYRLACFPEAAHEVRFETSGTTQGRPGVHVMRDTQLYDAAAIPCFRRALLADGVPRRFLSLTGSPSGMPHSSLVHMVDAAARRFGIDGRAQYFFENDALDLDGFAKAVRDAREKNEAVLVLTTAFALVHAMDSAESKGANLALPGGSRIMETGGTKGRSREIGATELYERVGALFNVGPEAIVNEYGMTEMSSQFYDRTDTGGALDPVSRRVKVGPPWVRTFVLDPATLRRVEPGETGMLAHVDLANLDSCAFLLTADAGCVADGGLVLRGRLLGAEMRGCSLDYEAPP